MSREGSHKMVVKSLGWAAAVMTLVFLFGSAIALALGQADDRAPAGPSAEGVPADQDSSPQLVNVVATDFQFDPRAFTVKAGPTSLLIRNNGVIEYNLVIEDA